jgi:hypothetical protein
MRWLRQERRSPAGSLIGACAERQQIRRRGEDETLVSGEVDVVAINQDGTLQELPAIFGPA